MRGAISGQRQKNWGYKEGRDDGEDMQTFIRAGRWVIAVLALAVCFSAPAMAGPPSYLILRRAESPGKHYRPGYYDAAMYDARTSGYAYGFFGAPPRSHRSQHFGNYQTYTQKSFW